MYHPLRQILWDEYAQTVIFPTQNNVHHTYTEKISKTIVCFLHFIGIRSSNGSGECVHLS